MSDAPARRCRARFLFIGHVQGVGFRFTVLECARLHEVGGCVRNLADGTVEVEAEGTAEQVDAFLHSILRSRLARYIFEHYRSEGVVRGQRDFAIQY